jgi:hypothetical protein
VCTNDHNGTCTAVLSRSLTHPDRLVASLICESCEAVVKILGVVEHTLGAAPTPVEHDLERAA